MWYRNQLLSSVLRTSFCLWFLRAALGMQELWLDIRDSYPAPLKKKKTKRQTACLEEIYAAVKIEQGLSTVFCNECIKKRSFLNYKCVSCLLPSNPVLLISVYFQSPRMEINLCCLEILIPKRLSLKLLCCI